MVVEFRLRQRRQLPHQPSLTLVELNFSEKEISTALSSQSKRRGQIPFSVFHSLYAAARAELQAEDDAVVAALIGAISANNATLAAAHYSSRRAALEAEAMRRETTEARAALQLARLRAMREQQAQSVEASPNKRQPLRPPIPPRYIGAPSHVHRVGPSKEVVPCRTDPRVDVRGLSRVLDDGIAALEAAEREEREVGEHAP